MPEVVITPMPGRNAYDSASREECELPLLLFDLRIANQTIG